MFSTRGLWELKQVVTCRHSVISIFSKAIFHSNINTMEVKSKTEVLDANRPFTVFIEGNIGSGKTTFLSYFNGKHAEIHSEPTDIWRNIRGHNVLQLMYQDPARWSFTFQSLVQKTMLDLHVKQSSNLPLKLMERSIYSARYCFVENLYKEGLMSAPEYAVLDEWFKWIITNMKLPGDLIVYLRTDPEVAYKRILERGREEESTLQLEYLKKLHQLHEDWLIHNKVFTSPVPVVILDANKSLTDILTEFKTYEPDIVNRIANNEQNSKNSMLNGNPTKINKLFFGDPADCNIISNSTSL